MSEALIVFALKYWLVAAVLLFVALLWQVFRPGSRAQMDRHARIPFAFEEDRDGRA
ncbi:cbb3-type cytochrome c oxidase subunit 3 [Ancylobacter polymorphus]|jgi:cbb3-type cytochrome oxidase subunit 3|uniref:Cbb3-type cytochrome oxidase subunit 3 n=1 Tax=Ancylobacter polymorphus TaxID=223390 RepID=A0ABU0BHY0_9HYPH|nr:cbb3-type cytochrome c oxidase subunit 3 [Ancylobacter polymorphus]MDQ0305035.1 cbb3-type cytochrome oxidase subunit 3 [Ancylobacter polymorphus]